MSIEPEAAPAPARGIRGFFQRHGRKLWWLHSLYALALGTVAVLYARKGFAHARWLVASLGAAWLIIVVFFRFFGSSETPARRLRFFVMTYVLKNLYQGMLFFLIPFYWKSASLDASNRWFLVLLGACALLSTVDVVFDQILMRFRFVASAFYMVTLFACVNLVVPAILPNTRTLFVLIGSAAVAAFALFTLYVTRRLFADFLVGFFSILVCAALMAGAAAAAFYGRAFIPPVPMYLSSAAVGPKLLEDGRLVMEVTALHRSLLGEMHAVTDVVMPGGQGDRLRHVWRHEGREVQRVGGDPLRIAATIRLSSRLHEADIPADPTGAWTVDVETEDGQLVGRARFRVIE